MKIFRRAIAAATSSIMAASMCIINVSDISNIGTADAAGSQSAIALVNDMGLGWNLGNTFDCWNVSGWSASQTEKGWGNPVTSKEMIDAIKASGFNSVRIPITWYENTDSSTFDISDSYLARIKKVVDYCIDNDMYVIINMHWDWVSNGSLWLNKGESALPQYNTMWKEISNYFKSYDSHLVFESLNEVTFSYDVLNKFNQNFVDTVRATGGNNGSRLLLLAGSNTDMTKTMNSSFVVPNDDMVAVSIHYYNPPTFCVAPQDSTWGYSAEWGTSAEVNTVYNDFAKMQSYFVDKGVPVIIGEYGALTNGGKKEDSVEKFLETVATAGLNTNGISTFLWDSGDCGDMQFFNRAALKWRNPDVEAIYKKLGSGSGIVTIDWVDTAFNQVKDDNGAVVDGAYQIDIGSATKVKFLFTGVNGAGGTGGVSYWDKNANSGKGAWVNNGASFRFSIDKDGNATIAQTEPDPDDSSATIDVNEGYIQLPDGVSTDNVQVQIYYAGYADAAGNWNTLDAADYPKMTVAQIPGVVDPSQTTTSTTTTTVTTTTTTTVTTDSTTSTGTTTSFEGVYGNAYLAGSMGGDARWNAAEQGEKGGIVADVDGNGTFEATWKIDGDGTGTIDFLMLEIASTEEFGNPFTNDTFPNISLTVDKIIIDGTEWAFEDNADAYDLRYYEGGGKVRAYLRANWGANQGIDLGLPEETAVTDEIKVIFTVDGTYKKGTSNISGGTKVTLLGDANCDEQVNMADAVLIMQALSNPDVYGEGKPDGITATGIANADVYEPGTGMTNADASSIQKFKLGIIDSLPEIEKAG